MTRHQSVDDSRDRLKALLRRRDPAILLDATRRAAQRLLGSREIWRGGVEPMGFDQFSAELDQQAMWPRQVVPFHAANLLRASSMLDPTRTITEGCLVWGKRGGKDMTIGKYWCYTPYVLSHLVIDPCELMTQLGPKVIAKGTRLDCPNVAPTADLARQVFFNYVKTFLSSPLFKGIEISPRPEKMMPGTEVITFPAINLVLYSKSSDASGLDGFNVFRYSIDEGDEFQQGTAERIRAIFRRTALATFGPYGLGFSFSYPRYEDGYILSLKKEMDDQLARTDQPPLFFVDFAPTATIRPDFDLDSPEILHEFEMDPQGSAAMFLCTPMATDSAFFPYREKIEQAVEHGRQPTIVLLDHEHEVTLPQRDAGGNPVVVRRIGATVDRITPNLSVASFLGGDAGLTKDSFALASWHVDEPGGTATFLCPMHSQPSMRQFNHYEESTGRDDPANPRRCAVCATSPFDYHPQGNLRGWWHVIGHNVPQEVEVGPEGRREKVALPRVYQDFLYQFKPVPATPKRQAITVDFTSPYGVYPLVSRICRETRVKKARFDPNNAPSIIQGLQDASIDADAISFSNPAQLARALLARILLNNNLLVMLPDPYPDDPWGRDVQWRRLQHKGTQGIDHPKNGAKDMVDADLIAIWCAALYCQPRLEMILMDMAGGR